MGDLVNLRQARKAKQRRDAEQAAGAARARHGRTKAQKLADAQDADRLARTLANSRRDRSAAGHDPAVNHSSDET